MSARLLLVDDHPIVREGLRRLLEKQPDFAVVGEAENGIDALQLIGDLKPDVAVIDIMMPGLNGLEVLREARKISPQTRAIVLSMQSADIYVAEALKLGAAGFVRKETGPGELVKAIHDVVGGNQYFSAGLFERVQPFGGEPHHSYTDPYDSLTLREREILQMVVEGRSSREIGQKLSISHRTVELHRSRMMKKLGLHSKVEVLHYALKHGILNVEN